MASDLSKKRKAEGHEPDGTGPGEPQANGSAAHAESASKRLGVMQQIPDKTQPLLSYFLNLQAELEQAETHSLQTKAVVATLEAKFEAQLTKLKADYDKELQKMREPLNDVKKSHQEFSELKKKYDTLQAKFEESQKHAEAEQKKTAQVRDEIKKQVEEFSEMKKKFETLQAGCEESRKSTKSLEAELKNTAQARDELKKQMEADLAAVKKTALTASEGSTILRARIEEQGKTLHGLASTENEKKARLEKLEKLAEANKSFEGSLDALKKLFLEQLGEVRNAHDAFKKTSEAKLTETEKECKSIKGANEKVLSDARVAMSKTREDLERSIKEIRGQLTEVKEKAPDASAKGMQGKVSELENQIKQLKAELAAATKERDASAKSLQATVAEIQGQSKGLKDELATVKQAAAKPAELTKLQAKIQELESQKEAQKAEMLDIKKASETMLKKKDVEALLNQAKGDLNSKWEAKLKDTAKGAPPQADGKAEAELKTLKERLKSHEASAKKKIEALEKGLQELQRAGTAAAPLVPSTNPRGYIHFESRTLISAPGKLKKETGATEWGSTAKSAECILCGPLEPKLRGLRFRPKQKDKDLIVGLGTLGTSPTDYRDIDFAVSCWSDGNLYVVEKGQWKRQNEYEAHVLIELRITSGNVELYLDGTKTGYSGTLPGPTTLFAMADFGHVGAKAVDIQWL